jgi:hypothetical protein
MVAMFLWSAGEKVVETGYFMIIVKKTLTELACRESLATTGNNEMQASNTFQRQMDVDA